MSRTRRPTIEFVTSADLPTPRGAARQTRQFVSTGDLNRDAQGDVPMARPASDSGSYAQRGFEVIRVRARAWLLPCIEAPCAMSPGGLIEIPTRQTLEIGQDVGVELGMGALADPVGLRGRVVERFGRCRQPTAGRGPSVLLRVEPEHADRLAYVTAVLQGERKPTARRHQRVPTDLGLMWLVGVQRHGARLANLSKGGAFLRAPETPEPGTRITLMLPDGDEGAIGLSATVAWTPESAGRDGFGVTFRFGDREEAAAVERLVLEQRARLSS